MKIQKIEKILVANRGEIAARVMRACRDLGIPSVAVFSDADRTSLHVLLADEAYPLGGLTVSESYLNQSRILEIARKSGADAIHPGYGFFSENPAFVSAVEQAGITFIGPSSEAIKLMGDKTAARRMAKESGIPVVSGSQDHLESKENGLRVGETIGYPVLLKAAAGGGGKGMRVVKSSEEFPSAFDMARSEAKNAFGDDRIFLEKYVENPRHIEIQVLADRHGNTIHVGERECSIQRRHQKVIEESPSPIVDDELRQAMGNAAVRLAQVGRYTNAGTVEFLVDGERQFHFLEVNTRLQVEHPVTEAITGIDLVKEQILIAEGRELSFRQSDIRPRGHAIECRIYAEDPANSFFPSTGRLRQFVEPHGPRVRVDSGFRAGDVVQVYYDPLLAKLVTWGQSREESISAMKRALAEFTITGVSTTIPFCQYVLSHPRFLSGDFDTFFVQHHFDPSKLVPQFHEREIAAAVAGILVKLNESQQQRQNHTTAGSRPTGWKTLRVDNLRQ